jgi:hypothetical protein
MKYKRWTETEIDEGMSCDQDLLDCYAYIDELEAKVKAADDLVAWGHKTMSRSAFHSEDLQNLIDRYRNAGKEK